MSVLASVVVPTRNRVASLARTLRALCRQTLPPDRFEAIVVADGCTPDTRELVEACQAPHRLRCIEQPWAGAAAARNRGAAAAAGQWLVFLDDDVEPDAGWLQAHLESHDGFADRVVVGPLTTAPPPRTGNFHLYTRNAWAELYERLSDPGHRWRFCDLPAANFSITAATFGAVGGFNEAFPSCGREDFELCVRLLQHGARFVWAPAAAGLHHDLEGRTVASKLERARFEGRGDVLIGRLHPELRPLLPFAKFARARLGPGARLPPLAFRHRLVGEWIAARLVRLLPVFERLHMERRWRVALLHLVEHAYLCAVADELGGRAGLVRFLADAVPASRVADVDLPRVDLAEGLDAARRSLDELRPAGVVLVHGTRRIATLPPEPGMEALAGRHLAAILHGRLREVEGDRTSRFLAIGILHAAVRARRRDPGLSPALSGSETATAIAAEERASSAGRV